MRMSNLRFKMGLILGMALILSLTAFCLAQPEDMELCVAPTPEGFDKALLYMANGEFNPGTGTMPEPDSFYREIMGFTDEQIANWETMAEQFFMEHYDLDFANATMENGVKTIDGVASFTIFTLDPRNDYRAYFISEEMVPSGGWDVRDGGWMVTFLNDTTIYGTYGGEGGKMVPAGSISVFGHYNIDVPDEEPIIIHYRSGSPMEMTSGGVMSIDCDLTHDEWGEGKASGAVMPAMDMGNGIMKQNWRNVLTFPAY